MRTPLKPVQIPLDFAWRPAFGREDFLVAPGNEAALRTLENTPQWPDRVLLLTGPEGSGKTHLARLWCGMVQGQCAAGPPATVHNLDEIYTLITRGPVALDDADRIADETLLFHAINAAREQGRPLLLTARRAPPAWAPRLPDLASRLAGLVRVALEAPDDNLLGPLLVKLLADRQLQVEPKLIEAILVRIDRSFAAARAFIAALDAASLSAKKPVSLPLIRQVLERE